MTRRTRLTLFWIALAASFWTTLAAAYMIGRVPGLLMAAGVWAGIVGALAVMVDMVDED